MRTRALRVTVGAYSDGHFHATFIEDLYDRGVLVNSELVVGPIWCDRSRIREQTAVLLEMLIEQEDQRVALDVPAGTRAVPAGT